MDILSLLSIISHPRVGRRLQVPRRLRPPLRLLADRVGRVRAVGDRVGMVHLQVRRRVVGVSCLLNNRLRVSLRAWRVGMALMVGRLMGRMDTRRMVGMGMDMVGGYS